MHPTFMRGNLIVWAIQIQVARDPELNRGNQRTIRGVYMTQLNRLERLAPLSAPNEWYFYV